MNRSGNPLADLWAGDYCWQIPCSTCGNRTLVARMRSIGGGDERAAGLSLEDAVQRHLLALAARIDIHELDREQPRWLGYLGLLLFRCRSVEVAERIATPSLVRQLAEVIPESDPVHAQLQAIQQGRRILEWSHLDAVEGALLRSGFIAQPAPSGRG